MSQYGRLITRFLCRLIVVVMNGNIGWTQYEATLFDFSYKTILKRVASVFRAG